MRIIAGTAGGLPIVCPKSVTRPTAERAREALFSILGARVDGARVLDLFAGSGALGLEALSRGARSALFIDHHWQACRAIESNTASTRLGGATVLRSAAAAWVKQLAPSGDQQNRACPTFDLIFADPPYCKGAGDTDHAAWMLESQDLASRLAPGGVFVLETQSDQTLPDSRHFSLIDRRVYGGTALHLLSQAASG